MTIDEGTECRDYYDEDSGELEYEEWRCSDCTGWRPEPTDEEIKERYEVEGKVLEAEMEDLDREFAHQPEAVYTANDFQPVTDDDICY